MKPSQRYAAMVAAGDIRHDPAQQSTLQAFDRIHAGVQSQPKATPLKPASQSNGWWPFGKKEPSNEQDLPAPDVLGLYVYGGVGRGKTFLMDLFTEGLPDSVGVLRSHFHRFMDDIHQRLGEHKDKEDPLDHVAADLAKHIRVLCLDEFFVDDIGDAMILQRLLMGLFSRGVMLVTTSNIEPDGLYKDGLQRVRFLPAIALLKQHCQVLHLVSERDHRVERLQGSDLYTLGDEAQQHQQMQQLYQRLTKQQPPSTDAIVIRQRTISHIAHAGGVGWFRFAALCEGPRAAADYIELAKRFHTLLIEGVPVMDDNDANRAHRFVHLIDELYDRRVNVILGAEAEPLKLYTGSKMTLAFERTISRLIEMRSDEYLAAVHVS